MPPAAAAPIPEKFKKPCYFVAEWTLFFPPPTTGRIADPATKGAANKTAPPPMIPKLLTAAKLQYFTR